MTTLSRSTPPSLYTIPGVAASLKVSPKTVRRWIDRGDLAVHRLGRRIRISDADLAAFLAARRQP
jgi:excisionase family DNA binding protein